MSGSLLSVRDLVVEFDTPRGPVRAVDGVSFELAEGERLGVVGESGSGKSVLSRTVMGLTTMRNAKVGGEVVLNGQSVLGLSERRRRALWGREVAMVFQDPLSALHPITPIGDQVVEAVRREPGVDRKAARARAIELLELVGIPRAEDRMKARAGELSGGMRQRVMIAMAMACRPKLLIADEPTTALDVTVQARVLKLFDELCDEFGIGLILVSHDLRVVGSHTDHVAVMYAGRMVEIGTAAAVFDRPMMRHSRALTDALPKRDPAGHELPKPIPGTPPNLLSPPPGCPFLPRCAFAEDDCRETRPELSPVVDQPGHSYACLHPAGPVAAGPTAGASELSGHIWPKKSEAEGASR
jgi:peptide/nickel transport system ATP-binding protein